MNISKSALAFGLAASILTGGCDKKPKDTEYRANLHNLTPELTSAEQLSCNSEGFFTIDTTCNNVMEVLATPKKTQELFHTNKAKINGEKPTKGYIDEHFASDLQQITTILEEILEKEYGATEIGNTKITFENVRGHADVFPDIKVRNLSDAHTGKKFEYNPDYRNLQKKTAYARANMFGNSMKRLGLDIIKFENISSQVNEIPKDVAKSIEDAGKYIQANTKLSQKMSDNAYHAIAIMLANGNTGKYEIEDNGSPEHQKFQEQIEQIRTYIESSHVVTTNKPIHISQEFQTQTSETNIQAILTGLSGAALVTYLGYIMYTRNRKKIAGYLERKPQGYLEDKSQK